MSVFDGKRLEPEIFQIDAERMRRGWYSDDYFSNMVKVLKVLSEEGYKFSGKCMLDDVDASNVDVGNIVVEMQFFTRREPFSLVAGVDEALAILQKCTGYYDTNGQFINTYHELEVEAVQDGTFSNYNGKPTEVEPVLKIRGRYREFGLLETPILGVLTEATRVATNVYNTLVAATGKDIMFFPARFAHPKLQALHGYAYRLAIQAYNMNHGKNAQVFVSTDEQGGWWGGNGGGTMAHACIACFLGDTVETMLQFARILPIEKKRVALVDFHNDCVGTTLDVLKNMFEKYWHYVQAGNESEAEKYILFGVRPDTSGNMIDKSIIPLGDKKLDYGVNPRLIHNLRNAIDEAYKSWSLSKEAIGIAQEYCKNVKIVATGGFNVEKITRFEEMGVPVDTYGVGSSLLDNSASNNTNNDFTADIVRVCFNDKWYDIVKKGRKASYNKNLERI